jgi:hypothetical protein
VHSCRRHGVKAPQILYFRIGKPLSPWEQSPWCPLNKIWVGSRCGSDMFAKRQIPPPTDNILDMELKYKSM